MTPDQRVHDDREDEIRAELGYPPRVLMERLDKAERERDEARADLNRVDDLKGMCERLASERDELAAALERILNPKLRVGEVTGIILSYDDWEAARAVLARVRGDKAPSPPDPPPPGVGVPEWRKKAR